MSADEASAMVAVEEESTAEMLVQVVPVKVVIVDAAVPSPRVAEARAAVAAPDGGISSGLLIFMVRKIDLCDGNQVKSVAREWTCEVQHLLLLFLAREKMAHLFEFWRGRGGGIDSKLE